MFFEVITSYKFNTPGLENVETYYYENLLISNKWASVITAFF